MIEKYIAAVASLLASFVVFAYGYGRLQQRTLSNAEDVKAARDVIDEHVAKREIHIDPERDRDSRKEAGERLVRVETKLDSLATAVQNQNQLASERQGELLVEVRTALRELRGK